MSQKPVQLIPLLCCKCRYPVNAQVNEVAWVCEQCGQGLLLDDTPEPGTGATNPLDIFFSSAIPQGKNGRPYWVASGKVEIQQRLTYKGNAQNDAARFWSVPRLFYVPAWEAPLEEVIAGGVYMLKSPTAMEPGSRTPFLPVVSLPEDMHALAEFLVVSIEAERSDAMKRIDFSLRLEPPQLWILP